VLAAILSSLAPSEADTVAADEKWLSGAV